jgi:hypothetical protein
MFEDLAAYFEGPAGVDRGQFEAQFPLAWHLERLQSDRRV